MTKQEEFLWLVQTVILANAIDITVNRNAPRYAHEIDAAKVLGIGSTALMASRRIPPEMSASDAATEFCFYMLEHLRHAAEAAEGRSAACPEWFRGLHARM